MSSTSRARRNRRSQEKRPGTDPRSTDDVAARRRFAIPSTTIILDGEQMEIDPSDEDQRELAIVEEHPEFRDVLEDPLSDELVDGVNPRLHIALHQILANQLWDDDPPEVWQAARRLLDQGHERHVVLHGLANELAVELHPVLTGEQAPDPEMAAYRARLRAL